MEAPLLTYNKLDLFLL